jgi:hypothetical protein
MDDSNVTQLHFVKPIKYKMVIGQGDYELHFMCFDKKPHWFHVLMQRLLLGFRWEKIDTELTD